MFDENDFYLHVKIFNMSPPLWLRESFYSDKKKIRPNIKNYTEIQKKKSVDNVLSSDVLAELQMTVLEKDNLKKENNALKSEILSLKKENENLLVSLQRNRESFEEELNTLKEKIISNEKNLIDNNKKCLSQQKKFLEEIKELKDSKAQLLKVCQEKENTFTEKIDTMEREINELQTNISSINAQNNENAQKTLKYKGKLKYAISVINDLNNIIAEYTSKPQVRDKESQTTEISSLSITSTEDGNGSSQKTNKNKKLEETEDLILSDIFFKSRAFCESELVSVQNY